MKSCGLDVVVVNFTHMSLDELLPILLLLLSACSTDNVRVEESTLETSIDIPSDSVSIVDANLVAGNLLLNKSFIDPSKYATEDCPLQYYRESELVEQFDGIVSLGDLDGDNVSDSTYVLPSLTLCEFGDAYYFLGSNIPRIPTDSGCCHPYSLFNLGDIDNDGGDEIAQYYSSCASRYKHIKFWTLKHGNWIEFETANFTLNDKFDVFVDFGKLLRTNSQGGLEFYEISDVLADGRIVAEWKGISL